MDTLTAALLPISRTTFSLSCVLALVDAATHISDSVCIARCLASHHVRPFARSFARNASTSENANVSWGSCIGRLTARWRGVDRSCVPQLVNWQDGGAPILCDFPHRLAALVNIQNTPFIFPFSPIIAPIIAPIIFPIVKEAM